MKTKDILALIEAHEQKELDRLSGPRPADPPALVEEPSELIDTNTAAGGWWRRRRYADGTMSRPMFRQTPPARYSNMEAYQKAAETQRLWSQRRYALWAEVRLLSGAARGWLKGNGKRGGVVPATTEELRAKYGQRIAAGAYLSVSGGYAAELLSAAKKLGLEAAS